MALIDSAASGLTVLDNASLDRLLSRLFLLVSRLADNGRSVHSVVARRSLDTLRLSRASNLIGSPSSKCAIGGGPRSGESVKFAGSANIQCNSSEL